MMLIWLAPPNSNFILIIFLVENFIHILQLKKVVRVKSHQTESRGGRFTKIITNIVQSATPCSTIPARGAVAARLSYTPGQKPQTCGHVNGQIFFEYFITVNMLKYLMRSTENIRRFLSFLLHPAIMFGGKRDMRKGGSS